MEVGPFTCFFRRGSTLAALTYARPTGPLPADVSADIALARAAFAKRGRVCRWEYLADLFPDFAAQLQAEGFPAPTLHPLMVVTPQSFQPCACDAAHVRPLETGESRAMSRMLDAAYGAADQDPQAMDAEADLIGGLMSRGAIAYGAFVNGQVRAGGIHTPLGDTTELAAIGTLPAFRRQGMASAVASALTADAFARNAACVFLSAEDEAAQRIYARIGFTRIGAMIDTADDDSSLP